MQVLFQCSCMFKSHRFNVVNRISAPGLFDQKFRIPHTPCIHIYIYTHTYTYMHIYIYAEKDTYVLNSATTTTAATTGFQQHCSTVGARAFGTGLQRV